MAQTQGVAAQQNQPSSPSLPPANSLQPWLVCFSAALFFFYEFIQLNMFNAIDPALMREFNMDATQLGHLSAYYFYGNVLFLFPAGMILDRFSTRKLILIAMTISVLSTFIFASAKATWVMQVCRLLTGITGAFCLLSCVRLATRWFPPRRMALVIGLIVTFAMIGGMLAQTPLTLLTDFLGWRTALFIDGGIGLLLLVVVVTYVQDYPNGLSYSDYHHTHISELSFWKALWKTVTNAQNWLGGIYTSLMNLPIFLLGAMWGSLYLVQIHGLSRAQSSYVTSMIFIGTIIGSPALGWFSDRIGRRLMPMTACAIFSLSVMLIIMYVSGLDLWSLMGLFFLLGFFTSAQIISYPLIAESNPNALIGSAEGLASTLIMAGGISQPLFGWLMELNWNGTKIAQVPVYSVSDYQMALAIMPIGFIIALLASLLLRETYCRSYK